MSFGQLGGHFCQNGVVPLSLATQSSDDGGDVSAEDVIEQWQDLMPQAIAPMLEGKIAGIFSKSELMLGDVSVNIGATPFQKRALEAELLAATSEQGFPRHASESCC
jgi:hypothetical protein